MQVAESNGINIHYDDPGARDGVPIVFSNSLGTDFRIWDRLVALLGDSLRLVRYDNRGHGLSTVPPAPYRIDDHVGDLIGLLDHLGLDEVVVCGLSVGGLIAQGLAKRQPQRVRGLILCDTAAKIGTEEIWADRIAAIESGGIEAIADSIIERWLSAAFRREKPVETAVWRNMLTGTPVAGYLGTCAALRDEDLTEAAATIAVPALCVCGDEDGATPPEVVRATAALIPGARFEMIEGAGHLPCIEQPRALAGLIESFLAENGFG